MFYFVSDIHLGFYDRKQDKNIENQFLNFLNFIEEKSITSNESNTLFLLGDIFDYWFEYKYLVPKSYYRTLAKLEQLISKKINIIYLMGNHDFGHKTFFLNEMGIEVIKDDLEFAFNQKIFFLAHGDDKLPNDHGYKILKKILRNKFCQLLFALIHPTTAINIATFSSRSSRKTRNNKHFETKDGLLKFAETKIKNGCDFVIMGHIHKPCSINITRQNQTQGTYINLGSWFSEPYYAQFDGTNLELIKLNK